MKKLILILCLSSLTTLAFAKDDFLSQQDLDIKTGHYEEAIFKTAENLKAIFDHYKIALGPGFYIVKPLEVVGTRSNPVLKGILKKCISFICHDVDLDASLTITKVQGPCDVNYYLKADLSRSSSLLTDIYEYFSTTVCAKRTVSGAHITLSSSAHRAGTYIGGPISSNILSFLGLQIEPIKNSLETELNKNIKMIEGKN